MCVDVCTPVCRQGLEQGVRCSDLSLFTYNSLRQGLLLELELGWRPTSPRDPPLSSPHSAGLQVSVRPRPAFYMGCRDLNSGLPACKAALIPTEASPQLPGHVSQGTPFSLLVFLSMPSSKGSKNWDAC